jgi:hypothetical protein
VPRWHVLGRYPVVRGWVVGVVATAIVAYLVLEFYLLFKHDTGVVMSLTQAMVLRLSGALPNLPSTFVVAALPAVVMYCLLECQFRRSEWLGRSVAVPQR